MPLNLQPLDVSADIANCRSVLIVSCPVCPPVSMAIQKRSPFLELFKTGLKTGAFEEHIHGIREPLEQRGVRTGVFSMYTPCPTMCLWTDGQRRRLLKRAEDYEAVLVLGCESARQTAQQALKNSDCQVIQAMQMTGLMNATVKFQFPMTLTLDENVRADEGRELDKVTS